MKRIVVSFALLLSVAFGASAAAANQQSVTYKGITITPAIVNVELAPNQASTSFKIHIANNQNQAISLSTSSLDFKSLNETGGVAFIGSSAGSLEHKYGLANWLTVPNKPLSLATNKGETIEVTIDNRQDLSPGGHYAAVLFKNSADTSSKSNRVSLNQVVAALVFLKKTGGEIFQLQLQDPKLKNVWFSLPSSIGLRISNTGNTQTIPRGTVNIFGPNGKLYEKGLINPDSGLVLPDSTRFYRTDMLKTGHSWLPGRYKVIITYRAEDIEQAQTAEFSFIYYNIGAVAAMVAILAILVTFIRFIRHRKK